MPPSHLVLASSSPRRRDLLRGAGVRFEIEAASVDESHREGELPEKLVARLSHAKARTVADRIRAASAPAAPSWVLGADTIVVLDGDVLGKPLDRDHAVALLSRLVGRIHTVLTGISVVGPGSRLPLTRVVASRVEMRSLTPEAVETYVDSGEPLDKAGAYAIQGLGGRMVRRVVGSETNVIGLPLDETLRLLREAGVFAG